MTELTKARRKTLEKIAAAGFGGLRPQGSDLTTAYWLRSERLVETFRAPEKLQLQYRINRAGMEALGHD